ncbi:MAG: hypothetical protein PHR26_03455 [Candidatus ainarchaeum sp.]|nr:hypothetical protein [Candidatus ainarchaeum sp.]
MIDTGSIISILGLIVSILGLVLSFVIVNRDNAKLYVKKEQLNIKKDKKEIWIYFYMTNIGKRPTTIKKIDFYNPQTRFMPNTTCVEVFETVSLGLDLDTTPPLKSYRAITFPLIIDSNKTTMILAKLSFADENTFKQESNRNKLKFKIRINYSNKKYETLI